MSDEHTIAIVSFSGALKREVKRIRRELQKVDNLPEFNLDIKINGRVHDGDVKLLFRISTYGYDGVKGDDINAVLDEFLRRHSWQQIHAPKAIGYERIPSDDSE